MKGDPVPDTDHIVRYLGVSHVEDDGAGGFFFHGSGFLPRRDDDNALSVNWLEFFSGTTEQQVAEVRVRIHLKLGASGRFARLNVGDVRQFVAKNSDRDRIIEVVQDPLDSGANFPEDPSHALMTNFSDPDGPEAEMIGDLIVERILDSFPARLSAVGL